MINTKYMSTCDHLYTYVAEQKSKKENIVINRDKLVIEV